MHTHLWGYTHTHALTHAHTHTPTHTFTYNIIPQTAVSSILQNACAPFPTEAYPTRTPTNTPNMCTTTSSNSRSSSSSSSSNSSTANLNSSVRRRRAMNSKEVLSNGSGHCTDQCGSNTTVRLHANLRSAHLRALNVLYD